MNSEETKAVKTEETSLSRELFFWAQALVFALVILVIINVFFARISGVDGISMFPTLHDRDQVLVQLIGYNEPRRGDIVVVISEYYRDDPLIKRVIGLGGDVINITNDGIVSVNGDVLDEPYINETTRALGTVEYPFTVPEGHVFVMGDNRNHSADSRRAEVGALPVEQVIGRAFFRIWPIGRFGKL